MADRDDNETTSPTPEAARLATVLVIDDDPLISRVIRRILKKYDVTVHNNGADAIQYCIAHRPALVLCDMNLTGMNGMHLYTQVQAQAPEMTERFVFMTGGVFEPEMKGFLDRIDNPVLMKPFGTKALRALVQDQLHGGNAG